MVKHNSLKEPTGAQMLARQRIAEELEDQHLHNYPPGRGDDTFDHLHFWAVYQSNCVEAICFYLRYYAAGRRHEMPAWVMDRITDLYAAETIRRRRIYIQSWAEKRVDAQLSLLNLTDKEKESQREVLRAMTHVLPSKRVRDKRTRLEEAMRYEFGMAYRYPDHREKLSILDW